jgi:hypothetical protein
MLIKLIQASGAFHDSTALYTTVYHSLPSRLFAFESYIGSIKHVFLPNSKWRFFFSLLLVENDKKEYAYCVDAVD